MPLLFVGFKFEPQEAIFISCCVDCCNACLILALSYWKREETSLPLLPRFSAHVRAVLIVGGIAVLCCCVCLVFAARILDVIKGRLKGGIGYVLLVIGALFILKGVLAYRKQRKLAQESEKVVVVTEEAPLLAVNQDIVEEVNVRFFLFSFVSKEEKKAFGCECDGCFLLSFSKRRSVELLEKSVESFAPHCRDCRLLDQRLHGWICGCWCRTELCPRVFDMLRIVDQRGNSCWVV